MTDISIIKLLNLLENKIIDEIKILQNKIEDNKTRLQDSKIRLSDKIHINLNKKIFEEKIKKMNILKESILDLKIVNIKKYEIPSDLNFKLNELSKYLTNKETKDLTSIMTDSLKNTNNSKINSINRMITNVKKASEQLGLSKTMVSSSNENTSFSDMLEHISKLMTNDLYNGYSINYDEKKSNTRLEIYDVMLLSKIKKMIESRELKVNGEIVKDFSQIKEYYEIKIRIQQMLFIISNILSELYTIYEMNTTKISKFLEQLEDNYVKELYEIDEYLELFSIEEIKKQIINKQDNNTLTQEQNKIVNYKMLAYELEKTVTEEPNNLIKINEIIEQMRKFCLYFGLSDSDLSEIITKGKEQYWSYKRKSELGDDSNNQESRIFNTENNTYSNNLRVLHNNEEMLNQNLDLSISEVYRMYVKYKSGLKDRTKVLPFSEYSKKIHSMDNADKVNEDIKGIAK